MRKETERKRRGRANGIVLPSIICGIVTGFGTAMYCLEVGLPPPKADLMAGLSEAQSKSLDSWVQSKGISPRDCVVEFGDFQCPYCRRATVETRMLKEEFGAKVHFVFGQFPLASHQYATYAALADLVAEKYGDGRAMFGWLMASNNLQPKAIQSEMVKLGIPKSVLESKKIFDLTTTELEISQKVGNEIGLSSIPSYYYIDSEGRVSHALTISALQRRLAEL